MRVGAMIFSGSIMLALASGCHSNTPPQKTAQDVDAAQQAVSQEVERAKAEASKDVKSASKVMGANSRDVALAKVTGAYDVAMVKADGDHTVAIEKCLTLQPAEQPGCKSQADTDYETAKAAAKATRMARTQ